MCSCCLTAKWSVAIHILVFRVLSMSDDIQAANPPQSEIREGDPGEPSSSVESVSPAVETELTSDTVSKETWDKLKALYGEDLETLQVKAYNNFIPDPWVFEAENGILLGQVSDIEVSFIYTRYRNGKQELESKARWKAKALWGKCRAEGNTKEHAVTLSALQGGATLDDGYLFGPTGGNGLQILQLAVNCDDDYELKRPSAPGLNPSIFGQINGAKLHKNGGRWDKCP